MKLKKLATLLAAGALALAGTSAHAIVVSANTNANSLANFLAGAGITISNATLSTTGGDGSGTFSGGLGSVGFDKGVLLTTGTINCAVGPNVSGNCTGAGDASTLGFDFTSTSGKIFFNYVFASEEYNEYVGSAYNDLFELKLNGANIALVPGGGVVSINNVNNGSNAAYYRDNNVGAINVGYDGLTTVLTATADLAAGMNHFEFSVKDIGDARLDSGVFLQAGSFSSDGTVTVPEPGTMTLLGLGLAGLAVRRRQRK